jgi:hypothetical protein
MRELQNNLTELIKETKELLNDQKNLFALSDESSLPHFSTSRPIEKNVIPPRPIVKKTSPLQKTSPIEPKEEISPITKPSQRLLPQSFAATTVDTSSIREGMQKIEGMPHLSSSPIYAAPSFTKKEQWAICTALSAHDAAKRVAFVEAITQAISTRLEIQTLSLAMSETSFVQMLPLIVDDCSRILFFIDAHLEASLLELLQQIPTFTHSSHSPPLPFSYLGSIHKKPLLSLVIHEQTSENQSLKQQLWTALRNLKIQR